MPAVSLFCFLDAHVESGPHWGSGLNDSMSCGVSSVQCTILIYYLCELSSFMLFFDADVQYVIDARLVDCIISTFWLLSTL
jgi:hypothetical protein